MPNQIQVCWVYNPFIKRINQTSTLEEVFNAITHGLGLLIAIIGFYVLLISAIKSGPSEKIIGVSVFGITLIFLYLMSTLYHSLAFTRAKNVFRILDHSSIFLFIAGTYTPYTLVTLKSSFGFSLLFVVWIIAIIGIILKIFFMNQLIFSIIIYLTLGWLCVIVAVKPLMNGLIPISFNLLLIGGIIYTTGVIFYLWKKVPFNHNIWHIFVLAGSLCHIISIFYI